MKAQFNGKGVLDIYVTILTEVEKKKALSSNVYTFSFILGSLNYTQKQDDENQFKQLEKLELKDTKFGVTVQEEKVDKKKYVHFPLNINLELKKGTYKKNEHSDILITKF